MVDLPDAGRADQGDRAARPAPSKATSPSTRRAVARPVVARSRRRRRQRGRAGAGGVGARSRTASRRSASSTRLHPVPAGDAARQLGQHPADRADREGQHGEQERDADQLGDADRALAQPDRADQQHGERAEAGQRLQHRVEEAAQPADRDQRVAQLAGPGREPVGLLRPPGPSS